jgi:hypothetical protein
VVDIIFSSLPSETTGQFRRCTCLFQNTVTSKSNFRDLNFTLLLLSTKCNYCEVRRKDYFQNTKKVQLELATKSMIQLRNAKTNSTEKSLVLETSFFSTIATSPCDSSLAKSSISDKEKGSSSHTIAHSPIA